MSGIVGGNLGRGSGLIKAGAIDDNSVTLAKMAGLARGKLIYGDTSGDPAALAVGGADEVLTHDGTDFDWAAAAGGGKILQVVSNATASGSTATTSEDPTFVQCSTPTAVITLASTSSKVLLFGGAVGMHNSDALFVDFYREISGGATTANISGYGYGIGWTSGGSGTLVRSMLISWVDSPSTTSEITYSLSLCSNTGTEVTLYQQRTICAIEIGV